MFSKGEKKNSIRIGELWCESSSYDVDKLAEILTGLLKKKCVRDYLFMVEKKKVLLSRPSAIE